jgi:hypothetical protein
MADGRWQMADGGDRWQVADGRWQVTADGAGGADGRRQSSRHS